MTYTQFELNSHTEQFQREYLTQLIKKNHQDQEIKHVIISDPSIIESDEVPKLNYLVWDWSSFDQDYDRLFKQDLILYPALLSQLTRCSIDFQYSIIFTLSLNSQNADIDDIQSESEDESTCVLS